MTVQISEPAYFAPSILLLKPNRERLYNDWLRGLSPRQISSNGHGYMSVGAIDANLRAEALDREQERRDLMRRDRMRRLAA